MNIIKELEKKSDYISDEDNFMYESNYKMVHIHIKKSEYDKVKKLSNKLHKSLKHN